MGAIKYATVGFSIPNKPPTSLNISKIVLTFLSWIF